MNSFIISSLEESTEYTVYVYGITKSGYEGKIISARTVAGKNVKETLSQMCSGNLTVEFDGVFSNAGLDPRLAVIAESKEPVDGIKIGTTALNASEVSDKNSVPEKKTGNSTGIMSKIYYPNVRVALVCFNGNTREQKILSDMLAKNNMFITATSVNESGEESLDDYDIIYNKYHDKVKKIYPKTNISSHLPSSVVDFSKYDIIVLREGAITKDEILACLGGENANC